jgi:hypothetical protein
MKNNKIIYQDNKTLKFLVESRKFGNFKVIIDVEDWDKIKEYKWYVNYNPYTKSFYAITTNKQQIKLHRFIMDVSNPKIKVDHKDHNTLDNRKYNLRICDQSENLRNCRISKRNTSGYKGVSKTGDKWKAQININNKRTYLGLYKDKKEAARIYNENAIKYYKEFAYLNEV